MAGSSRQKQLTAGFRVGMSCRILELNRMLQQMLRGPGFAAAHNTMLAKQGVVHAPQRTSSSSITSAKRACKHRPSHVLLPAAAPQIKRRTLMAKHVTSYTDVPWPGRGFTGARARQTKWQQQHAWTWTVRSPRYALVPFSCVVHHTLYVHPGRQGQGCTAMCASATNVTIPGLAAYHALLALQELAIRECTRQVRRPRGTPRVDTPATGHACRTALLNAFPRRHAPCRCHTVNAFPAAPRPQRLPPQRMRLWRAHAGVPQQARCACGLQPVVATHALGAALRRGEYGNPNGGGDAVG
eukprot:283800-Chlamydomonas_euryale.AAC.2